MELIEGGLAVVKVTKDSSGENEAGDHVRVALKDLDSDEITDAKGPAAGGEQDTQATDAQMAPAAVIALLLVRFEDHCAFVAA